MTKPLLQPNLNLTKQPLERGVERVDKLNGLYNSDINSMSNMSKQKGVQPDLGGESSKMSTCLRHNACETLEAYSKLYCTLKVKVDV